MALLWVEGWDQFASGTINETVEAAKYNTDSGSRVLTAVEGRNSGIAARVDIGNNSGFFTPPLTTNATLITGFAFYTETVSANTASKFLSFRQDNMDGSTIGYDCIDLYQNDQAISLTMFGTGVNTSANVLSVNTWYYLEMKVYCHNTNGTVEVKLDGNTIITYSGDTRYADFWDHNSIIGFRGGTTAMNMRIDDWYICDGSGTTCNDFLGDCRVYTLFPDGDASGNMTANSGSDEYAMVSGNTVNLNKYIKDTTTNNEAVFTYGGLPDTPNTVYGVMVTTEAKMSANLYKGMKTLSQNGSGTINAHTAYPVQEVMSVMTEVFAVNADGSAWTPTLVNDARFGVRVV